MADLPKCPNCGTVVELHDMLDECPPIPTSHWGERWRVSNGEGGTLLDCSECGVEFDTEAIVLAAGLPADYPRAVGS